MVVFLYWPQLPSLLPIMIQIFNTGLTPGSFFIVFLFLSALTSLLISFSRLAVNIVFRLTTPMVRTPAQISPWNHRCWMSIWLLTSLLRCLSAILNLTCPQRQAAALHRHPLSTFIATESIGKLAVVKHWMNQTLEPD